LKTLYDRFEDQCKAKIRYQHSVVLTCKSNVEDMMAQRDNAQSVCVDICKLYEKLADETVVNFEMKHTSEPKSEFIELVAQYQHMEKRRAIAEQRVQEKQAVLVNLALLKTTHQEQTIMDVVSG